MTRYWIVRELGAGTSGIVYEVVDGRSGQVVALKQLRSADPEALYRFKREFRTLQGLRHPNLVRLHEMVVEGNDRYFTMDLVDGVDFRSYVCAFDREQAGEATTAEIDPTALRYDDSRLRKSFQQLARALTALHEHGKIHRDLKPSNVLVRADGHLVVVDFGLVFDTEDPLRSNLAITVGTPAYMAPEQASGGEIGPPADWYAAGVMLYEALTGRLPHDGGIAELLDARCRVEPLPPSAYAMVPRDLDRLCIDLLRLDPELRPRGREVLARLEDGPRPRPITVPPAPESRERELALLERVVRRPRSGHGGAVCVCGPTGSGKTAMLRHIAAVAAIDGATAVLSARCHPGERVAFGGLDAIIDGVSRVLCELPIADQFRAVPDGASLLTATFPVLTRVPVLATLTRQEDDWFEDLTPEQHWQMLIDAVVALLRNLAEHRHLVFVIDDLDDADEAGLTLLRGMIRHAEPPPIAMILAARDPERLALPRRVYRMMLAPPSWSADEEQTLERRPGR